MATARVLPISPKKTKSTPTFSDTPSRPYKPLSPILRSEMAYLRTYLPAGALQYFKARHCGKGVGLVVQCDVCGATPKGDLRFTRNKGASYGYTRWRWLTAHIRSEHV